MNELKYKGNMRNWAPLLLLAAITVVCLSPFIGKAFNFDDPLFLWAAKNIQTNTFNPYGFKVNWYGYEMAMYEVTKNPPLTSYYIALIAYFFGWDEIVLHLAFLIPAIGVILGTYLLSRQFCRRSMIASLTTLFTPVFLVSGTTVMCDSMMLALWIFSVYYWVQGLEKNTPAMFLISAFLIAVTALTKYYGLALIPLLILYSAAKRRGLGMWVLYMLIPISILAMYQWATHELYGRGLLMDAFSFATGVPTPERRFIFRGLIGLTFTGGCIIVILFFTRLLWPWRAISAGVILAVIIALLTVIVKTVGSYSLVSGSGPVWATIAQLSLFAIGGVSLLALSASDLWRNKDADSVLLFLWIIGTFVFAGFVNWTINGRSILPMIPAASILIARRIEQRNAFDKQNSFKRVLVPLAAAAAVSLAVACSDYRLANSVRTAAAEIHDKYVNKGRDVWFQGHWGFQYYMESLGAKAIDADRLSLKQGDIVIIPSNNTNLFPLYSYRMILLEIIEVPSKPWLTTMNHRVRAGFYNNAWGPLPFAVGPVPLERYGVYEVS